MARHGKRWRTARAKVDSFERYSLDEGFTLLRETTTAKFPETIEVAVRLGVDPRHADQMIRGAVSLPNGTGRDVRVVVFAQGEAAKAAEEAGADSDPEFWGQGHYFFPIREKQAVLWPQRCMGSLPQEFISVK